MAYDEQFAERVRSYFKRRKGAEEKRMFGGLCFMLNGHMCCGIDKDRLMIRVQPGSLPRASEEVPCPRDGFYREATEGLSVRQRSRLSHNVWSCVMARRGGRLCEVEAVKEKEGETSSEGYCDAERDAVRQKKFRAALEEGNRRYGSALKKLAE